MYNESQCIIYALYAEDNGNTLGRIHYSLREQIFPSFPSRTSTTPELSTMEKSKRSTPSAVYFWTALKLLKEVMHLLKRYARILIMWWIIYEHTYERLSGEDLVYTYCHIFAWMHLLRSIIKDISKTWMLLSKCIQANVIAWNCEWEWGTVNSAFHFVRSLKKFFQILSNSFKSLLYGGWFLSLHDWSQQVGNFIRRAP